MPDKTILIVEDEQILVDVLERRLKQEDYEVEVARDGQQGLELIQSIQPDLILLDIVMPKMGGFEVLEKMNEDPELSELTVMVISNSGQPVQLDKAEELGAEDWIIKTEFDPDQVIKKVGRILT